MDGSNVKLYDIDGIKVSGTTLINHMLWERVHQTNLGKPIEEEKYIYNLITINNLVEVKGLTKNYIFRDFPEEYDEDLNDKIDLMVLNRLNLMRYS